MMEGEKTTLAMLQYARHSRSHSTLDPRLISSEKTALSTTAATPDDPATNHQALTEAMITREAVVIRLSLLSLSNNDLRFLYVENMNSNG